MIVSELQAALLKLQDDLALSDLLNRPRTNSSAIEYLVKRHKRIAVKIDGSKNHARAHLHIDYGKQFHSASYAIDDGELLAGYLERGHERLVVDWIAAHRALLMEAWRLTQSGQKPENIIAELKASEMG